MRGLNKWGYTLVLLFFASIPWEISRALFPPFETDPNVEPLLTFVRISTFLVVFWGIYKLIYDGWKKDGLANSLEKIFRSPLFWAVIPLFLAAAVSLLGSYQMFATLKEGGKLGLFCLLGISIALAVKEEWALEYPLTRIYQLIFALATAAALFAVFQYVTGMGIWGGGNADEFRRVNSTFVDPNIFARYLNISILCTLILLMGKVWQVKWWHIAGLIIQSAALVFTFSRTGWLTLAVGLLAILIYFLRHRLGYLLISLALLGGAGLGLSYIPVIRERLASFTGLVSLLGQRIPLIQGGWEMFKDHPLTGVGLGNFQWAIENPYRHMLAEWSYVTRSHTTLVTAGAEMGIWGVLAMVVFIAAVIVFACRMKGRIGVFALANTAGILTIWLSSQGEGRFFEDPLVWALWGLSLAIQWKEREGSWLG